MSEANNTSEARPDTSRVPVVQIPTHRVADSTLITAIQGDLARIQKAVDSLTWEQSTRARMQRYVNDHQYNGIDDIKDSLSNVEWNNEESRHRIHVMSTFVAFALGYALVLSAGFLLGLINLS